MRDKIVTKIAKLMQTRERSVPAMKMAFAKALETLRSVGAITLLTSFDKYAVKTIRAGAAASA